MQIRDVPDELTRTMKARAAAEGQSLSEYVLRVLLREAATPTRADILRKIRESESVDLGFPAAELIRADRDARS
jgi:antitoxin FitA